MNEVFRFAFGVLDRHETDWERLDWEVREDFDNDRERDRVSGEPNLGSVERDGVDDDDMFE